MPFKYEGAEDFHEGMAAVSLDGKEKLADMVTQLDFLEANWKPRDGYIIDKKTQTNIYYATYYFCVWYEQAGTPQYAKRYDYAKATYKMYTGKLLKKSERCCKKWQNMLYCKEKHGGGINDKKREATTTFRILRNI